MNVAFAYLAQKALESVKPAFVTSASSQLKKQFIWPVESNGPQISAGAFGQSLSLAQWRVQ